MRDQPQLVMNQPASGSVTAVPRLEGSWFRLARNGWILLALIATGVLLTSLPGYALRFQGQLSHISPQEPTTSIAVFAALSGLASLASTLLSLGLSWVFFRRRLEETAAAALAFYLLIYAVVMAGPLEAWNSYWAGGALPAETLQAVLLATPTVALLLLFPSGRFVPPWTRWVLLMTIPWNISLFFLPGFDAAALNKLSPVHLGLATLWYVSFLALGFYAQVIRYRRVSSQAEKQQTKWVLFGFGLWLAYLSISTIPYLHLSSLPPGSPTPWWAPASVLGWFLSLNIVPVTLAIAVTRHRLWDIDVVINRTLVYGALTAVGLALYMLVVVSAGLIFHQSGQIADLLLTAVFIIILFRPMHTRLQMVVNTLAPVHDREPAPPVAAASHGQPSAETTDFHSETQTAVGSTPWLPILFGAITLIIAVMGLILLLFNWTTPKPARWGFWGFQSLNAIPVTITGFLIAGRHPRHPIGWLMLAAGLSGGLAGLSEEYSVYATMTRADLWTSGVLAAGLGHWFWVPSYGLMAIFLPLLFPDGRFLSPRWRLIAWLGVTWIVLGSAWLLLFPGLLGNNGSIENPFGVASLQTSTSWSTISSSAVLPPGLLLMALAAVSIVLRYRRSDKDARHQLKWFAYAAVLLPIAGLVGQFDGLLPDVALFLIVTALPVSIAIAILRYRLYDIDLLINRTLVYGALMACVVGVYALVVGMAGALAHAQGNWLVTLVATGLVAVIFQPLRERLQRSVNRLLYGERAAPMAVLSQLGRRLETAVSPEAMLPTLVETVARTLKLPYVAVGLQADGAPLEVAAEYGKPVAPLIRFPLVYRGKTIGQLLVAPRQAEESFTAAEMTLLENIARQAGAAVHAVQLTADLRRSRQRLVTTREEERRRLRRDLHDDLGPQLASLTLTIDAIAKFMHSDPDAAAGLLQELKGQSQTAVQEIRRLVYDLRPPALDDLGLTAAVRESAARYRQGGVQFTIEASDPMPPLPAAVEVAAFRIAQEAMTNVVRHAQAKACRVTLALERDALCVTVQDDGCGLPADLDMGIGLRSMQERAAELEGRFTIESVPMGGVMLRARLPLMEIS